MFIYIYYVFVNTACEAMTQSTHRYTVGLQTTSLETLWQQALEDNTHIDT